MEFCNCLSLEYAVFFSCLFVLFWFVLCFCFFVCLFVCFLVGFCLFGWLVGFFFGCFLFVCFFLGAVKIKKMFFVCRKTYEVCHISDCQISVIARVQNHSKICLLILERCNVAFGQRLSINHCACSCIMYILLHFVPYYLLVSSFYIFSQILYFAAYASIKCRRICQHDRGYLTITI